MVKIEYDRIIGIEQGCVMLKTILVPIGDIKRSKNAIQQAVMLSEGTAARVYLLGLVQHNVPEMLHQFSDPVSWNAVKNQKQADLSELAHQFTSHNVPVEIAMLDAFTDETFIRYMHDHSFDLIVFAEEDRLPRTLIRQTLAHVSVPVYVARCELSAQYRRILIPLDGSKRAESVLPLATTIAQSMNATLLLTHIIKEPDIPRRASPNAEDMLLAEQLTERNRHESEHYLNDLNARLPVDTEIHIRVHDSVPTALHQLIEQQHVDLVVMSAHGFSGKPNQAFGGITSNLIEYCVTPFVILQDLPARLPALEAEVTGRYSGVS